MYAVFQIGNKQYRVFNEQIIHIERITLNVGEQIEFNQVLFLKNNDCVQIGNPFIKKVIIIAKVLSHGLNRKIKIIKFHRRKHYRKCQGHRQKHTKIQIINIQELS